jgi:hypothetical protein
LGAPVTLLRGLGGGHFEGAPAIIGTTVDFADDGGRHRPRWTPRHRRHQRTERWLSLFFGNGRGDFAALPVIPVGRQLQGIVAADLDGNGAIDSAISDFGGDRVAILLGDGRGSRNALCQRRARAVRHCHR